MICEFIIITYIFSIIDEELQAFTKKNETNPYYVQLLKVKMDKYFGKKNVTNVKECLKEGTVYGPLCAYRLFYVGCSRAKRNLVIKRTCKPPELHTIMEKCNGTGLVLKICETKNNVWKRCGLSI